MMGDGDISVPRARICPSLFGLMGGNRHRNGLLIAVTILRLMMMSQSGQNLEKTLDQEQYLGWQVIITMMKP